MLMLRILAFLFFLCKACAYTKSFRTTTSSRLLLSSSSSRNRFAHDGFVTLSPPGKTDELKVTSDPSMEIGTIGTIRTCFFDKTLLCGSGDSCVCKVDGRACSASRSYLDDDNDKEDNGATNKKQGEAEAKDPPPPPTTHLPPSSFFSMVTSTSSSSATSSLLPEFLRDQGVVHARKPSQLHFLLWFASATLSMLHRIPSNFMYALRSVLAKIMLFVFYTNRQRRLA